ncbi:MAG: protein translocase subunit SecF [Nanoarchaeota archaeon]
MAKLTRRERRLLKRGDFVDKPIVPLKQEERKEHVVALRGYKSPFSRFYDKNVKRLMIIPIILLVLSLGVIIFQVVTTGSFISKGISLTGGQTITVTEPGLNAEQIESTLRGKFPKADINVRALSEYGTTNGIIVETTVDVSLDDVLGALRVWVPDVEEKYSVETIGANLGQGFFRQVLLALLLAFVFMSIVIFLLFKTFWPSMAVIAAALSDMIVCVAVINLLGIKVSTAGIAALLMLIGYSVDTDILLTTRLLKAGKGDYLERTMSAMKTGLTMTVAAIAVVLIGMFVSQSDVLRQIFTILFIGLIADIIFTYIQNVSLLWTYMEKKKLKK